MGIAITLADGWTAIPLDGEALQEFVEALPADTPTGQLLKGPAGWLIMSGVRLLALDTRSLGGGILRLIVQQRTPTMTLAGVERALLEDLENRDDVTGELTAEIVRLPAIPALVVGYTLELPTAGETSVDVATRDYVMLHGDRMFRLTMAAAGQPGVYEAAFDAMARSIEFTG